MQIEDLAGAWRFARPGHAGREEHPAVAEVREGETTIQVPGFGRAGLVVRVRREGEVLRGVFEIPQASGKATRGEVELAVRSEGRMLVGYPRGFANRERWQFERAEG